MRKKGGKEDETAGKVSAIEERGARVESDKAMRSVLQWGVWGQKKKGGGKEKPVVPV